MNDIDDFLNDIASETVNEKPNQQIDDILGESVEQGVNDVFNEVADNIFSEETPATKNKTNRPKGKYGILKSAAQQNSIEGNLQAELLLQSAADSVEVDLLAEAVVDAKQRIIALDVEKILAGEDFENASTDAAVDALLNEAAALDDYSDDDFFVNLDTIGAGDIPKEQSNLIPLTDELPVDSEADSEEDNEEEDDEEVTRDPLAEMALRHMCYNGELSNIVKKLRKDSVDIRGSDAHGWTCLHWAASQNQYEVVDCLLDHAKSHLSPKKLKLFINAQDLLCQWTALHVACVSGHKKCVEVLLEHKAKKRLKSKFGEIAVECVSLPRQSVDGRLIRKLLGADVAKTKTTSSPRKSKR